MGCGCGTNTRAKILAPWGLLYFALQKGIFDLHVFGDSKILIEWVNDKVVLHVALLDHWLERFKWLKCSFHNILLTHVYKELSEEADSLSKRVLGKEEGVIIYEELLNISSVFQGTLQVFG